MIEMIAFSDWRTQSFELFTKIIKGFRKKPDLILYVGGFEKRFTQNIDKINWFERIADCSIHGLVTLGKRPGNNVITFEELRDRTGIEFKELESKDIDYNSIIISHHPPLGILDDNLIPDQQGSERLRTIIDDKYPLMVIKGQSVQGYGTSSRYKTTNMINLSGFSDDLESGTFVIITIDKRKVGIKWMNTKPDISDIPMVSKKLANRIIQAEIYKIEQLITYPKHVLLGLIDIKEDMLIKIINLATDYVKYESKRRSRIMYLDIKSVEDEVEDPVESIQIKDLKSQILEHKIKYNHEINNMTNINEEEKLSLLNSGISSLGQLIKIDVTENETTINTLRLTEIINHTKSWINGEKKRNTILMMIQEEIDKQILSKKTAISNVGDISKKEINRLKQVGIEYVEQLIIFDPADLLCVIPIKLNRISEIIVQAMTYIKRVKSIQKSIGEADNKGRGERKGVKRTDITNVPNIKPEEIKKLKRVGIEYVEQLIIFESADLGLVVPISLDRLGSIIFQASAYRQDKGIWKSSAQLPDKFISINIEVTTMIWMISARYEDDIFIEYRRNWKNENDLMINFLIFLRKYPSIPLLYFDGDDSVYNNLWNRAKFNGNNQLITEMSHRMWINLNRILKENFITPSGNYDMQTITCLMEDKFKIQYYQLKDYKGNHDNDLFLNDMRSYHHSILELLPLIINHFQENIKIFNISKSRSISKLYQNIRILKHGFVLTCNSENIDELRIAVMMLGLPLPTIEYKNDESELSWVNKVAIERYTEIRKDLKKIRLK